LVRRNARDMHVADLVEVLVSDSTKLPVQEASFDRVLLDAPCSGLGSLRRRPDARWRMEESEIPVLVTLQKNLVDAAVRALKVGGTFVYSVCTLTADETVGIDEYIGETYPELEALPPVRGHGWEPVGRGARIVPAETDGMAVFRYELTIALPPLPVIETPLIEPVEPVVVTAAPSDQIVDGVVGAQIESETTARDGGVVGFETALEAEVAIDGVSVDPIEVEAVPSSGAPFIDGQYESEANTRTSVPTSTPAPQPRRKDKANKPVAPSVLDLDEL
jgi:hypothetical protein